LFFFKPKTNGGPLAIAAASCFFFPSTQTHQNISVDIKTCGGGKVRVKNWIRTFPMDHTLSLLRWLVRVDCMPYSSADGGPSVPPLVLNRGKKMMHRGTLCQNFPASPQIRDAGFGFEPGGGAKQHPLRHLPRLAGPAGRGRDCDPRKSNYHLSAPDLATRVNKHVHLRSTRAVLVLSTVGRRRVRRSSLAVVVVRASVGVRIIVTAIPIPTISAGDPTSNRNTYWLE